MALLAEDERMLKNILMELNDKYEDYGMKININKTITKVIGRTPKKIDMRIKDESFEQADSFKYLGCNICSNLYCCQEVKQRIAMAKEAFNRKRSIFCGPLEKELRKRVVKCFVQSVVLYGVETWTLRQNEQKRLEPIYLSRIQGLNLIVFSEKVFSFLFCSCRTAYIVRDNVKTFTLVILSYKDLILFPKKYVSMQFT